jgi:hypothetical protein
MSKELDSLQKDVDQIKQQVRDISNKIDLMLEILNSFSLMVLEDEEEESDDEDIYDSNDTWVPDEDSWENTDDEEY